MLLIMAQADCNETSYSVEQPPKKTAIFLVVLDAVICFILRFCMLGFIISAWEENATKEVLRIIEKVLSL